MNMMIKNKSKILLEGRYDTLTRIIVSDVMQNIRETEGEVDDIIQIDLPEEENFYYHKYSGIKINVDLRIQRTEDPIELNGKEIPYYINSFIATDDYFVIEITINETYGKKYYRDIYYKLNEDVRHEIEHYVQEKALTDERFKTRKQPIIPSTSDYETVYLHHIDPSEVEALVHGFYRRAKKERVPLDTVMIKDLESDIEKGQITQEEAKELFNTWLIYARRNLPKAIYSK
jgi:hypothetical protein